jgi:ABC-type bacteriocin/lantibiotic exporter with double-glycine peptidase domain
MKKIIAAVILGLAVNSAVSEEIIQVSATCLSPSNLAKVLAEFKETASLTMTSYRENGNDLAEHKTVLFINYNKNTWTLVEQFSKDKFCVTATGDDIKPYFKK